MKKAINIFILLFYTIGSLLLPLGDFSVLNDIPKMYQHCKSTEDEDMTAFDFITDHLINIDCIFDKHENGDSQKPHAPFQFHHQSCFNYYLSQGPTIQLFSLALTYRIIPEYQENKFASNFLSNIFRPPIV